MKKLITYFIIILSLFIITGCNIKLHNDNNKNRKNIEKNNKEKIESLKIIIEKKEYIINLEKNKTTKELINLLPQELEMNELNGNEKYTYLNSSLPTNPYNPKHINKGDVMLYGNNCLVIFYESFDTSYYYTKIGHINNLPNFGDKNIKIIIKK